MSRSLWNVKKTASYLGLSEWRVYDLVRQGILPAGVVVRLGRTIKINPEKLEKWVESGGEAWDNGWKKRA